MKLTKCMVLASVLCVQLQMVNAAQENMLQCVNNSMYNHTVSAWVAQQQVLDPVVVPGYQTVTLDMSMQRMIQLAQTDDLRFTAEYQGLVSNWTAAVLVGARHKARAIDEDDVKGLDPKKHCVRLIIKDISSDTIVFQKDVLQ